MRKLLIPFLAVALVIFAVAPFLIHGAPYEMTMGLVQKIFYFHVPAAILTLVWAFVAGIASALFLFRKSRMADYVALAASEMVVVLGSMMLVSGPLWGRKAWGVWWVWDPRLTSSLMLWITFVAYLLLRRFGGPGSDKLGAGMALFGMANVPFIYVSVNYWRTLHPQTSVVPNLVPPMAGPLWFAMLGFLTFSLVLVALRVQLEEQRDRVEALYLAADES